MKQACLVEQGYNVNLGRKYEIWKVGDELDGRGIYVDFDDSADGPETTAFPYDLHHWRVTSWDKLGCWPMNATGGRAMRALGYVPVDRRAMKTGGILPGRLANWRCIPLEMYGLMPCTTCECFDRQTLECVSNGCHVSHELLNVIRDLHVEEPQYPDIEVVEDGDA